MTVERNLPLSTDNIGYLAHQAINEEQTARVIGSTSRGIFLQTPRNRIIFISNQPYRSPLTINVHELSGKLETVVPGMPADLSTTRIEIPEAWFELAIGQNHPWIPPSPHDSPGSPDEQHSRLKEIAGYINQTRLDQGFGFMLVPLLDHGTPENLNEEQSMALSRVQVLEKVLAKKDPGETLGVCKSLLGFGRGLTPSGDDFIMGLLLTLNRWPVSCRPVPRLAQLNQLAIQSAYLSTTAISANLIECATFQHSDERLLSALDGIVTGNLPSTECAEGLLSLGSSSGIDALAGFIVALDRQ